MRIQIASVWSLILLGFLHIAGFTQYQSVPEVSRGERFTWPEGKQVALSLSFDDGRSSQLDVGIPILNKYRVKATFYINPSNISERVDDWKMALAEGHELANHTLTHPCSGNFVWSRDNALEDRSLEEIRQEIEGANQAIKRLFGIVPRTFAYPCGQKFVGRGLAAKSYIPLVAESFLAGRGWLGESANDPAFCDLAQILGVELDGLGFRDVEMKIEEAKQDGHWLVFCGHDIGGPARQTTVDTTLEALCRYSRDPRNGVWIDTVERVAEYIRNTRKQEQYRAAKSCPINIPNAVVRPTFSSFRQTPIELVLRLRDRLLLPG